MNIETYHERPEHIRIDGNLFLEKIEEVRNNPHETLIVMQEALGIDVGRQIDFAPGMVRDDPATVRASRLSPLQYEKITSFRELVSIYIDHGTFTPPDLGGWFDAMQVSIMDERKPIDVLFSGFSEKGFDRESLWEVSEHAMAFLWASGREAIEARWED